jgi:hypothetical protein
MKERDHEIMKTTRIAFAVFLLVGLCSHLYAGTVTSTVGDIDGFSPGDAADVPYRSVDLSASLNRTGKLPFADLDDPAMNWYVGFTHAFSIPDGETILGATLTVGVHPGDGFVESDFLALDVNVDELTDWGTGFGPRAVVSDIWGGVPPRHATTGISIDLSQVPMRPSESGSPSLMDLLPELLDGEFNVIFADDSGVDYSILALEVTPEPATLSLLALGGLALVRRRKHGTSK